MDYDLFSDVIKDYLHTKYGDNDTLIPFFDSSVEDFIDIIKRFEKTIDSAYTRHDKIIKDNFTKK